MVADDKKDIRLVGYGILGSAIVALIYDIVPIWAEKGLVPDITLRMFAFSGAIVVGILSILIFPKIKRMRKSSFSIIIGTSCGIAIWAGILWILLTCRQTTCLITDFGFTNSNMLVELITSVATLGMVGVLIWQTRILAKQSRLSFGPAIYPRFIMIDKSKHIHLFNVGKGNAVDIHLQFKDANGNSIGKQIESYVLINMETKTDNPKLGQAYSEYIDTGIIFSEETFRFKVEGWYRDTNGDKINATREYEYPPKLIK